MPDASAPGDHLAALYGPERAVAVLERLEALQVGYRSQLASLDRVTAGAVAAAAARGALSERDAILIAYPDGVREPGVAPLRSLSGFCGLHLRRLFSGIHLLPFFPSSSDDGFSVIDYHRVDPALGTWEDVARLGQHFRLMFDAVLNHVSASSAWFQAFLRDDSRYRDYFIVVPDGVDLSAVVRPRALRLLTPFSTSFGPKAVWTTFSADQIDLNYHNPDVLLEAVKTVLSYAAHGASLIRLDAVAYLWKEPGTSCIHLPQTHQIVQLLRSVLNAVAPHVLLITETNVPHEDNVSYFGDGTNEAHAVYNFALPPLILHAFQAGSAALLSHWVERLRLPSQRVTFLNFLASHDGIGLNPSRGILSEEKIEVLVEQTVAHGGLVSYKSNGDGTRTPYELNINYFDALSSPQGQESLGVQVDRFTAAHAIMLSLAGVPGIYFHSLLGSHGWSEGVALTGQNRTINRQKLPLHDLEAELARPASLRHCVFGRLSRLLRVRSGQAAFDPYGGQRVLPCGEAVFALLRESRQGSERVLCLHNVAGTVQRVEVKLQATLGSGEYADLINGRMVETNSQDVVVLQPYEVLWIHRCS